MGIDNTTLDLKVRLRRSLLAHIEAPFVVEAFGGIGKLYYRCYQDIPRGVAFETQEPKAIYLARQRPHWAVYNSDCVLHLATILKIWPANFFDLDAYGDPWPATWAILSASHQVNRLAIVITDGLRIKTGVRGAWITSSLEAIAKRYGNEQVHRQYKEFCAEMFAEKTQAAGFKLLYWTNYYCGAAHNMTHHAAIIERVAAA